MELMTSPFHTSPLLRRRRGRVTRRYTAALNTPLKILMATLGNAGGLAVIMTRLQADVCLADAMLRLDYCY